MGNASDFELMYRLLEKNDVKNKYINKTLVTMRYGGSSNKTIYNILNQNLRIIRVLNINFNILIHCNFLFSKVVIDCRIKLKDPIKNKKEFQDLIEQIIKFQSFFLCFCQLL